MGSYFIPPANYFFKDIFASNVGNIANVIFDNGNVIAAGGLGYLIGNGAFITGVTSTAIANIPAVVTADIRGNLIGNYANVNNIIASSGNISNVRFVSGGNVTASYYFGDGSQLTGITATANIPSIVAADIRGNIIGNYANVSNVSATFGFIANVLFNNGNVTAAGGNGFFIGNGSLLTGITATANIPSIVTADIRGNIIGNYANVSNVSATFGNIANVLFNNGNVTAAGGNGYFFGNGALLTGITATANIPSIVTADIRGNIIGNYANVSNVSATFGNIANVLFNNGNVTAAGGNGYFFGNGALLTGITATANIPSIVTADIRGNIIGNYANVSNVSATFGNIANVLFNNGNVTAAGGNGYFFGNGALLTGITATANIPSIVTADIRGNIIGNYANVSNVSATFGNIANVLFNNGNVTAAGGNGFFIGNGSLLSGITATADIPSIVTADIRGNIIGNYTNVSNVIATFGNIANVLFNNGNVTAAGGNGYFFGNGALLTGITATANIPSIVTADIRGNIIGNYANVNNVTATFGNIANVLFNNGNVTAAGGNGYFFGNGSQLTGVTATLPSIVTADIRGNIIGNYANVSNVIATFGNIANVLFNNGNVTAAGGNGYFFGNGALLTGITATANIPSIVTADIRGNIIGNYANVSNVTATFGNIGNVLFNNGNVTAAGGNGYFFGNGTFLNFSTITTDIRGNIIGNYANVGNVIAGNVSTTLGNIGNVLFNNGNVTAAGGNGYFFGNGTSLTFSTIRADIRGNIIGNYANVANVIAGNVNSTFGNIAGVTFDAGNVSSPVDILVSGNVSVGSDGLFRGPTNQSNNALILRGIGGTNTVNLFSIGALRVR
uniref:Glycoprotein Vp260 n=1 Tax=Chlorella virus TaxID=10507 RepID=Q66271_9PHYC|nr:glycoprotein Vp260 [Chlorella virus]